MAAAMVAPTVVTPQVAMDKLSALGTSAAIAAFLTAENITGTHDSFHCPVARYIRRETGMATFISPCAWSTEITGRLPMPDVVEEFIHDFDAHLYPALWSRAGS